PAFPTRRSSDLLPATASANIILTFLDQHPHKGCIFPGIIHAFMHLAGGDKGSIPRRHFMNLPIALALDSSGYNVRIFIPGMGGRRHHCSRREHCIPHRHFAVRLACPSEKVRHLYMIRPYMYRHFFFLSDDHTSITCLRSSVKPLTSNVSGSTITP